MTDAASGPARSAPRWPRRALLAAPAVLAGCSVLSRAPYVEPTAWPLTLQPPEALPPRRGGKMLVVRDLSPAPGLEQRGVQWLRPDGSLHVDFYNQWAVPPAEGATEDLRRWLAGSGLFAAVVGPEAGIAGDFVLQGELAAFLGEPSRGVARAVLALVLTGARGGATRLLMQRNVAGETQLVGDAPAAVVRALRAALAVALGRAAAEMRRFAES